jgi:prepilin signal peptidase PulO-like enzyme (type II secretory pathway)
VVFLSAVMVAVLTGLYLWVTSHGRWQQASAGGLLADHRDLVLGWFWRSSWAEVAVWWWIAAVSGTLGSFLNVVVYRLPRGRSLAGTGSRCIRCQTPIRWYDNQPVIGWFLVGGRCRTCRHAISVRYPLVEALAIGLGMALFGLTVQSSWIALPVPHTATAALGNWHYWLLEPAPARGLALYFCLLPVQFACLALASASVDGHRLPVRFFAVVAALAVGGVLAYDAALGPWLSTQWGDWRWRDALADHPLFADLPALLGWNQPFRVWDHDGRFAPLGLVGIGAGVLIGGGSGYWCGWCGRTIAWLWGSGWGSPVLSQAPLIFCLFGLVGGWSLPWIVLGVWSLESLLRGWGRRLGQRFGRLTSEHGASDALWLALPLDFLLGLVLWRWWG